MAANLPPTTLILRKQPTEPWSEYDFLCVEAMAIIEAEQCQQCGLPKYLCRNSSPDLEFDIVEDDCRATVAKHDREESDRSAGGEDWVPPVGTTLRPVPFLVSGGDPAELRDEYYRAEAERRAEMEG